MEGLPVTSTPRMDWSSGDLSAALKSFQQHCEFVFGEKGRNVYNTWNLSSDESKKLSTYYEKFEAYLKPKSNNIYARYRFHNIVQQEKVPFEQFLTKLKIVDTKTPKK